MDRAACLVCVRRLPQNIHSSRRNIGAIPGEEYKEHLSRRGWRRSGYCDRDGRRWLRRREPVDEARDKIIRVIARTVPQTGVGDSECRLRGAEITVIEIEGEGRVEVIANAGNALVTELPSAVIE